MDEDIERTVHSLFGNSANIVDCEKSSQVTQNETLFINGIEIKVDCDDTAAIKTALLEGHAPSVDILNQLLYQAGLLREPIEFETSLSVKSSLVTTEEVCVSRQGQVLNERISKTKEDHVFESNQKEIWHPILGPDFQSLCLKTSEKCKTIDRKELTEKQNMHTSPQKSATFAAFSTQEKQDKTISSGKMVQTKSPDFSNSDLTVTDRHISPITNAKDKASFTYDSGHDGLYHSNSQCAPWNQNNTACTENSFSSCYDGLSSSEELSFPASQTKVETKSLGKVRYRKPQTTISLPMHSFIDDNTVLRFVDDDIVSGPLDCLIMHLVPSHDYTPEAEFIFSFLLCSRIFLKPRELLNKVHSIWAQQQEFTLRASKAKISKKLLDVLTSWLNEFPYDFCDDALMKELRTLIKKCCEVDQLLSQEITNKLQNVVYMLEDHEKHEKELNLSGKSGGNFNRSSENLTKSENIEGKYSLMRSESQPISWHKKRTGNCFSSVRNVQALSVMNVCNDHAELAHQLTAIEFECLRYIGAEELLMAFETEFEDYVFGHLRSDVQIPNHLPIQLCEKTKNVTAYIQWFNRLTHLTATEIVKCQKKKHRVQMIEYWIEVARECFNTGNFNSLMAILAGLNLEAVSRLKKTWAKVQSAKFSVLEHQMDPTLNFSSYRSTMKAAVWRSESATDERQRVVIPFFSLFLKDLCTLNKNHESRLPNGHINFSKLLLISKQMHEFNRWKRTPCPFEKLTNVKMLLQSADVLNRNDLLLSSFACESPGDNTEKDLFKTLKSATN